jgi:hypothetical protein
MKSTHTFLSILSLALLFSASATVLAEDSVASGRPHFEGQQAESFAEALKIFEEANEKLEDYLDDEGDIAAADIAHVHELTYTIENALERIRSELSDLAVTLETLHLASEKGDTETVMEAGRNYLSVAEQLD